MSRTAWLGGGRFRCRRRLAALVAVTMLVPQVPASAPVGADTAAIREYVVPSQLPPEVRDSPDAIVRGPDGNLWFTETYPQKIGRISPKGVVTQFAVEGYPTGITVGPDGNLWFIQPENQLVGRMSPDGKVLNQFPVPWLSFPQGNIQGITTGPDNRVWISDAVSGKVGWISTTGVVTEFTVPGGPFALTPGPDGNLWFTEYFDDKIGKLDPRTGTVLAEYPVPRPSPSDRSGLADIVTGPDGNLWFTQEFFGNIGRITPEGDVTVFPVPGGDAVGITAGPDGNLWFAERAGNRIGRITPAGEITEIHVPTTRSRPVDIVTGPDQKLWFTESGASQIGRLDPATVVPRPKPCLVVTTSITLTRDVGPCSGTGIVVLGDNLTLNLNGHRVYSAPGPRYGDFPGIYLAGVSGVTVSNGTVTGFDAGVAVDGGSGNTLTGLNVHHNVGRADTASTYGDGIVLFSSSDNQIVNNVVAHNGMYDGIGVLGLDSNNNTIRANRVTNNTNAGYAGPEGEGTGIILNPFLNLFSPRRGESLIGNNIIDNVVQQNVNSGISSLSNVGGIIRGNIVEGNGFRSKGSQGNEPGNGIGVQANSRASQATQNVIESNQVRNNFNTGIEVQSNENHVSKNTVEANGQSGIVLLFGTQSNHVVTNVSARNPQFDLRDYSPECGTNVWRGNVWRGEASPPCTQVEGRQVGSAKPTATRTSISPAATSTPRERRPTARALSSG